MKRPTLTTAHVICEALKLRGTSALSQEEENFRELICRYGLTDAGLIFVAAKNRALVLTDDGRLFSSYSENSGYAIELLDNYLQDPA